MTLRLASLHVHPLKSSRAQDVPQAHVLHRGLADDRSWMAVDSDGTMLTARMVNRLLNVRAEAPGTTPGLPAALRLNAPGRAPLDVAEPCGQARPFLVHSDTVHGIDAGDAAAGWLSDFFDREVRLVWCPDPASRQLASRHASPGDHTAFADAFPISLASSSSLTRLNQWIAEAAVERGETAAPLPLPMERFRPSVVVDGAEPFAEDHWRRVRIGDVWFRVTTPCSRCAITTIDPDTLAKGKEPIRTLAKHRSRRGKVLFAIYLVPESTGILRVGDPVEVEL